MERNKDKGNGQKVDFHSLDESAQERLINKAFMEHVAFPNYPDRKLGRNPESHLEIKFHSSGAQFNINGDGASIAKFLAFLGKMRVDINTFADNFTTSMHDFVDPVDGNQTALNRGWLSFYANGDQDLNDRNTLTFSNYLFSIQPDHPGL